MKNRKDFIPSHFITTAYLVDNDGEFIPKPDTEEIAEAIGDFHGVLFSVDWKCADNKISLSGKKREIYTGRILVNSSMSSDEVRQINDALRFSMYSKIFGNAYKVLKKDNELKFFGNIG